MTTSEPCAVCHVVPHKLGCPHGAGKVSLDVTVVPEVPPYTDEALYGRTKENR